jgi:prevent-host-death family protein
MLTTTVRNTRINLTKLLKLVGQGDRVIIKSRATPIAMLVPYEKPLRCGFPDLTEFRNSMKAHIQRTGDATAEIRAERDSR